MKRSLLEELSIFLLKKGFTIKNLTSTCFDMFARNEKKILLLKILEDANSITREYCCEMARIASYINATPLIISNKAGNNLEDNVIYSRFDIITLNFSTFCSSLSNKLPVIKRTQAGLTACIDGNKLKKAREELGYSLNSLSKIIGVTTKMVVKYENNNSEVTVSKAGKIYDVFGEDVFKRINIFSHGDITKENKLSKFSQKYVDLGFLASDTSKVPFDIIAKKDNELILTAIGDKINPNTESLSRLLDADNLMIYKKKKPKGIPSLSKEEFMEFDKANELIKFLREF